jgi:hypothetical protein
MTHTAHAVLIVMLTSSPAAIALARQTPPEQQPTPPVSVAELKKKLGSPETLTATIVTLDRDQGIVVLKGETGTERSVYLGTDIDKLKNVKVGDRIKITYYMSLGTNMVPPGETAQSGRTSAAVGTAGGTKPGGTLAKQARWVVTVNSVDQQTGTVTVTTDQGRTITFLAEDKARIAQLKPNDRLEVVLTAAALVSVEPAVP